VIDMIEGAAVGQPAVEVGVGSERPGANRPRVVVGVDGSEASSAALRWAAEEARLRHAVLHVVHAWHIPAVGYAGWAGVPVNDGVDWAQESAAGLAAQVEATLGDAPQLEVVREVVEGPAVAALLEAAQGAELVVVGSRGRGGFAGLRLGSVSAHVVHHARCPVTVVHETS
jgi:nucleotide-binding universal stress UspA family protein